MTEQLRSLRYERDLREHGAAVTTRPWWDAPGEESRDEISMSMLVRKPDPTPTSYVLANVRPGT